MSCDVAASITLWLAALSHDPAAASRHLLTPVTAEAQPRNLAKEPLYARIVVEAKALKTEVEQDRRRGALTHPDKLRQGVAALADLDMKGHEDLARRDTDGDLKCILRGIAQDLPVKLGEALAASDPKARDEALRALSYLLNDNVEVITAPPRPPV